MNKAVRFPVAAEERPKPDGRLDECVECLRVVLACTAPPVWHMTQTQFEMLVGIFQIIGRAQAEALAEVLNKCSHAMGEPRGVEYPAKKRG